MCIEMSTSGSGQLRVRKIRVIRSESGLVQSQVLPQFLILYSLSKNFGDEDTEELKILLTNKYVLLKTKHE